MWLDFDEFLAPPSEGASLTDRTVLPMMLEGQILVHPHVAIDFSLPWAGYLSSESGALVLGDFTFGVHAVGAFFSGPDAALAFSSGLSVALPALPPVGPTGSNFGGYLDAQGTLLADPLRAGFRVLSRQGGGLSVLHEFRSRSPERTVPGSSRRLSSCTGFTPRLCAWW